MKKCVFAVSMVLVLFCSASAHAVYLDAYDNALVPDGFYVSVYQNLFFANQLSDSKGHKAQDLDFQSYQTTVRSIYYKTVSGIPVVFQLGVPVGSVVENKSKERSSGLGDIWGGPGIFLYKNDNTKTYISYWLYFFAPTGDFRKNNNLAQMGYNHWYFENQLAISKAWDKLILDVNLNYYIHTKETAKQVETPDRFETEISLAYQVTDKILAGINLGGHWDLADYKYAGVKTQDSGAERYEVGPALGYNFTDKFGATLRWNHDVYSKNDFKADSIWLRASYAF